MLPEQGHVLRIYVGESDKHQGMPLYKWIVEEARKQGMAGATVLKGAVGFGAHSMIHTSTILRLSEDLPVIVEIVDTIDRIDKFLPKIEDAIREGLAIVEEVEIRWYRSRTDSSGE